MLSALLLAGALASSATSATPPTPHTIPATPIFRSYDVADGLPSADVYAVTQDHAGYIWIGTHAGLVRYDSHAFKVFRHVPDQPTSLPANDVSALLVDRKGHLWVGGEGTGLNRYDPKTGGFQHWMHNVSQPGSLAANDVMAIVQDPSGAIWIGTYAGGLDKLDPSEHTAQPGFTHFRHIDGDADSIASDNVIALAADAHGGLWIGTDVGLDYMDARGHVRAVLLPGVKSQPSIWQVRMATGGVDAATSAGLFHIDANGNVSRIGDPGETLASLRGRHGGIWIARRGGLTHINADGSVHADAQAPGLAGSLPGHLPDGLFRDHEGGLWVSLMDGGLAYLPPQWRAFSVFRHAPAQPDSLASDRVRALALAQDGSLWVGGARMLDHLDPATGTAQHVALPGIEKMSIAALALDARGDVWIGGQRGLHVWDGKDLRAVGTGDPGLRHGVRRLLMARDGTLYGAAVGAGIFRVAADASTLQPIAPASTHEAALETAQLNEAPDGAIWVATHAGLARLAPGGKALHWVPGLPAESVQGFGFGPDHDLWVAFSNRLAHYRLHDGAARLIGQIASTGGWPDTAILGLAVDADDRVIALGTRNLLVFDPHDRTLRTFALAGGIAVPDFTGDALLMAGPGQLFAGSLAGVIGIRTAPLLQHIATPKVALESVEVRRDGQRVQLDPDKPISLDWHDRELTVAARVLSYVDPARNQYRFRLQGFDPGWVDTGDRDVREFSLLEPGSYRLLLSGRTGDGPWSAPASTLTLDVHAAPWATPWAKLAYLLVAILVACAVVLTMRRRLRQRHRLALSEERQQVAEQANMAKSRFLANMAHEIRTPLTGVLGMTELLLKTPLNERQHQYADAIRSSGALLLRQVNDALDVARIEARRLELNLAPFDPAAILREVANAEAGLAAQKNLRIDVVIAPDAPRAVRGDALRVQQILFNLTHNALKFTTHGGVTLKLERDADGIAYSVIDNGPGMTPEECARIFQRFAQADYGRLQRGSGLGLAISRELVGLMGGHIGVQSMAGRGSTFSVRLPLASVTFGRAHELKPAHTPSPGAPSSGARVLLVEDDPVAGQAIGGLIETFGYPVTLAPQALAALSEIDAGGAFDAMVFDFDLPGMDGCELAKLLRQRGVTTPIIALTASAHGDEEQRAQAAGMDACLRKPVLSDDLREV
ncbi:MAG TPA: two-component regulator propeller domain-containing protein, partial [Rhodanobacteraceae bacterium]